MPNKSNFQLCLNYSFWEKTPKKSVELPIALEVERCKGEAVVILLRVFGRPKTEAVVILLRVQLSNDKIRQSATLPPYKARKSSQPIS
jgi:hypothetical protein